MLSSYRRRILALVNTGYVFMLPSGLISFANEKRISRKMSEDLIAARLIEHDPLVPSVLQLTNAGRQALEEESTPPSSSS
jgi:hypothetical protein